MEKYITDEHAGLKYELIGDYYFLCGDDEAEDAQTVGIWGQRRLRYLREHRQALYAALLLSGKLHDHLANIDDQAESCCQLDDSFFIVLPYVRCKKCNITTYYRCIFCIKALYYSRILVWRLVYAPNCD
jgi:hypothetical protein